MVYVERRGDDGGVYTFLVRQVSMKEGLWMNDPAILIILKLFNSLLDP